jgi:hypothetical protein
MEEIIEHGELHSLSIKCPVEGKEKRGERTKRERERGERER